MLGYPILGAFYAYKSGHALNNQLIRALMQDETAWEYATFENIEDAPSEQQANEFGKMHHPVFA